VIVVPVWNREEGGDGGGFSHSWPLWATRAFRQRWPLPGRVAHGRGPRQGTGSTRTDSEPAHRSDRLRTDAGPARSARRPRLPGPAPRQPGSNGTGLPGPCTAAVPRGHGADPARPVLPAASPYAHVTSHVAPQRLGPPRLGSFQTGTHANSACGASLSVQIRPRVLGTIGTCRCRGCASSRSSRSSRCSRSGRERAAPGPVAAGAQAPAGDYDSSWQFSLSLANICGALIRQEDSIIFRSSSVRRFRRNAPAVVQQIPRWAALWCRDLGSLLEYVMTETEGLHGKVSAPIVFTTQPPNEHS